jgi:hypothetical protein
LGSVVMECTRHSEEELVRQSYDVHVCVSGPGAQITAYHRLRFALQASSWFPRPLGIALWSALHVLLLVGGVALLVLQALTTLVLGVSIDIFALSVLIVPFWLLWLTMFFTFFFSYVCKFVRLGWLLTRFSLSLICESGRLDRIKGSFAAWWAQASWDSLAPRQSWGEVKELWEVSREILQLPVSGSGALASKHLVREVLPWYRVALTTCCEEVVHMHEAISI